MTVTFASKIDTWIAVLLGGSMIVVSVACWKALTVAPRDQWFALVPLVLLGVGLPLWIMSSTSYALDPETLVIRSGPLRWRVPLSSITSVTPTRNPLSSPALSLDRLRIVYGPGRWILISPREKERFLDALRAYGVGPHGYEGHTSSEGVRT